MPPYKFSIQKAHSWWFFYTKNSLLIKFLYENPSLMYFLYVKHGNLIIDDFSIPKAHSWWAFLTKSPSFMTCLYKQLDVDDFCVRKLIAGDLFMRKYYPQWLSNTKMGILNNFSTIKTSSLITFYTKRSFLITFLCEKLIVDHVYMWKAQSFLYMKSTSVISFQYENRSNDFFVTKTYPWRLF